MAIREALILYQQDQHVIDSTKGLVIFSDSKSAIEAIRNGETNVSCDIITLLEQLHSKRKSCIVQWIPAHVNIEDTGGVAGAINELEMLQPLDPTSEDLTVGNKVLNVQGVATAKERLISWFKQRRKSSSSVDKWGSQLHRVAVALHLANVSFFSPGNTIGQEITYELTIQLLHRLSKGKQMSSEELALYIHAMMVACMNPRDFYGLNLVQELRKRTEANANYTNPFQILVLCNSGDKMTTRDVDRVMAAYDSQHRPFWTDTQALSSLALACLSTKCNLVKDERILKDMLQELKRHQFRNGTVDNLKTTALVVQVSEIL
ncbi:gastric intrinsic factor [Trichonephila clavipes]|nr:gastric intrinsic factor [Trichonephila clavipes]